MVAHSELPAELQRAMPSLSASCQTKLVALHAQYHFDDDQIEAFMCNFGKLSEDNLPTFQDFLKEEASKAVKQPKPERRAPRGVGATKRKQSTVAAAPLPPAVGAALGLTTLAADAELERTPFPKRQREVDAIGGEDGAPSRGTPDPPQKPRLQVSLRSSVNSGKLDKAPLARRAPVAVELLGDSSLWTGKRHGVYTWMDETLEYRAAVRDARLASLEGDFAAAMRARHESEGLQGEDLMVGTVGVPAQAEAVLCGRLVCEGLEGRLNERSILLEGSKASSKGARVQLNLAECQRVAAFPGQLVSVLGRSGMTGTTFHARDFVAGLPPPPAATAAGPGGQLHMMVASGPYCLRDGLDYSPLEQALEHAAREKPQVLVLLGPLVDAGNQKVCAGEPMLPGEDEPCTFEEIYTHHVLPLLVRGLRPLRQASPPTEVLLVPSLEEVLCFHPLPQPPLSAALGFGFEGGAMQQLQQLGVRFLPNPAHVNIDGLRVSITSADALSPVLREIVLRPEGRKIEEALRLLLGQRTLFPVVPRDPPQVSEARAAALDFPDGLPDVCIFPSVSGTATGAFVEGTVFVNPGSLCRPAALGSFAELWLAPAAAGGAAAPPLRERARVDIQTLQKSG